MKTILTAFAAGFVFSLGLVISEMTHPARVIGFLDVFGKWDPTLVFVMGGAVATYFILFRLITRRSKPVLAEKFGVPTSTKIDAPLLIGAAMFGVGWGVGGICPGPALASITTGASQVMIFLGAMVGGMYLFKLYQATSFSLAEKTLTMNLGIRTLLFEFSKFRLAVQHRKERTKPWPTSKPSTKRPQVH